MKGMLFHALDEEEGREEPRSVLDKQRSPSSPNSTSTPSVSDNPVHNRCLPVPIPAAALGNVEASSWDSSMLFESDQLCSDHSFLRWFTPGSSIAPGHEILPDPGIAGDASLIPMVSHPPSPHFPPFSGFPNNTFENYMPSAPPVQVPHEEEDAWQHNAVVDQLFKAAELVQSGNTVTAHRILARLNHQLSSPSAKPLIRTAFYFKEALLLAVSAGEQRRLPLASPVDVLLKLSACKAFAEISPVVQFTSFTSTQVILEELAGAAGVIHIIDFDVGVGCHWPALIQELSERQRSAGAPLRLLRITAFVSMSSHHQLELYLIQENLTYFAARLNVPFELNFLPLESFNPAAILCSSPHSGEAIAVNLSFGFCDHHLSTQTLLSLIKQLSPKILISANIGYDRGDLSFSQHVLHSLQSSTVLLDSVEASGVSPEVADRIERYLLRPRIESSVLGRYRIGEKLLPWRTLFTSAGFIPMQFSNFAETQADCLLKKVQLRGFEVEKRQAALVLSWQRGEIAVVSAWRC